MWWAEHELRLMRPLPDGGGTERDALEQFERRKGRKHPDAIPPVALPSQISYLWTWFFEMNQGRRIGGMGTMLPIPPSEIAAWCQIRRTVLADWEIDTIWALDALFRKVMAPG